MPSMFSEEYLHIIEAEGYHSIPKILYDGTARTLRYADHHPLHIASTIADHVVAIKLKQYPSVKGALAEWHELKQKLYTPGKPFIKPTSAQMKQLIHIFSRIFLFNKLKRIDFEWKHHLYRKLEPGTVGSTAGADDGSDYLYKIEIDPEDLHLNSETPDHFTSIISTLLHECAHAFLFMYSCCYEKCAHPRCKSTLPQVVGLDDHGLACLRVASHVEGYARQELLGGVNTGFWRSLNTEIEKQGCFLSLADVGYFHEDHRAEFERIVRENMPGLTWIKTLQGMAGLPARLVDLICHYYTKWW